MTTVTSTYSLDLEAVIKLTELSNKTGKAKSEILRELIKSEHERKIGTDVADERVEDLVAGLG